MTECCSCHGSESSSRNLLPILLTLVTDIVFTLAFALRRKQMHMPHSQPAYHAKWRVFRNNPANTHAILSATAPRSVTTTATPQTYSHANEAFYKPHGCPHYTSRTAETAVEKSWSVGAADPLIVTRSYSVLANRAFYSGRLAFFWTYRDPFLRHLWSECIIVGGEWYGTALTMS